MLIQPCSRRRRKGCGRCRNPTPWRPGTAAARRGPTARPGGPSARARGSPCARSWRARCPRTSMRQRRAKDGRAERIDGDAGLAPFAAERLGDAVDRRFRRAVGGIAGRMAEQAAGRRHQDRPCRLSPCLSICRPAARAISHDCVTLASITSRNLPPSDRRSCDTLLMPEATTRMSTRPNRSTAASTIFRSSPPNSAAGHGLDLAAELLAFGRDLLQFVGVAGGRARHWRRRRPAPSPPARRTRRMRR